MLTRQLSLPSLRRALDAASLVYVGFLLLLTFAFSFKLEGWLAAAVSLLIAGALYMAAAAAVRRLPSGFPAAALHISANMILFSFLFKITGQYQHLFVSGWLDSGVIAWEKSLVGVDLSIFLQRVTHPALTEWMMFAYVIYIPMLPFVALACYWSAGGRAATDYLLSLSLAYIVCYLGFIAYPVAGPLCHYPERFAVPLDGGMFTWCGEWIRNNMHYPGGCLPSPHCAAGTVMMIMLYRYHRKLFGVALPVLLTIYAATVYGRYHYLSDSVSGILVAVLAVQLSPVLVLGLDRLTARARQLFERGPEPGSVPE